MEAEDGLVTVLRGHQDTHVTIKLIQDKGSTTHHPDRVNAGKKSDKSNPRPTTFNGSIPLAVKVRRVDDSSTQVVDDRYTSSYQKAHCHVVSTSPELLTPEYPLRTDDPGPLHFRGHSNFALGDTRTSLQSTPRKSFRDVRESSNWDRTYRCYHSTTTSFLEHPSRASDPFVASLRQYPPPIDINTSSVLTAQDRSPSVDLIEKIISFTQRKNNSNSNRSRRIQKACLAQTDTGPQSPVYKIDLPGNEPLRNWSPRASPRPVSPRPVSPRPVSPRTDSPRTDSPRRSPRSHSPVRASSLTRAESLTKKSSKASKRDMYPRNYDFLVNRENFRTSKSPARESGKVSERNSGSGTPKPSRQGSPQNSQNEKSEPERARVLSNRCEPDLPEWPKRNWSTEKRKLLSRYKPPKLNYDYLKAAIRSPEVRYLGEMTKYVKDTIKNIYNESLPSLPCADAQQRRYMSQKCPEHADRKISVMQNTVAHSTDENVQSRVYQQANKASSVSNLLYHTSTPRRISFETCTPRRISFEPPEHLVEYTYADICICEDEFNHRVDNAILEWLKCVPVLAVCIFSDQCVKTKGINQLKEKLKERLLDSDEDGAKEEIIRKLNSLPIWYPYDPDVFKCELAEDLLNRLRGLKIDRSCLADWLNNVPLWKGNQEREQFAKLVESKYLELLAKGLDDYEIKMRMTCSLAATITELLEVQGKSMDGDEKYRLVADIYRKFLECNIKPEQRVLTKFELSIIDWIEGEPKLKSGTAQWKEKNLRKAKCLAFQIMKYNHLPKLEARKRMKEDIMRFLNELLDERGLDMIPAKKMKLVEALVAELEYDKANLIPKPKLPLNKEITNIKNSLIEAFEDTSEMECLTAKERVKVEELSENIAKRVFDLRSQGLSDSQIKNKILTDIETGLDDLLEDREIEMDPKQKKKILDRIAKTAILPKTTKKPLKKEVADNINTISKFLESVPELKSRNADEKLNLEDKAERMAKRIDELRGLGMTDADLEEVMQDEIDGHMNDVLESKGVEMDPKRKGKAIEALSKKLFGTPYKRGPQRPVKKAIANAKNDMMNNFKSNPEFESLTPDQQTKLEEMTEDIAQTLDRMRAQGVCEEDIKKMLRKDAKRIVDEFSKMTGVELGSDRRSEIVDDLLKTGINSRDDISNFPELSTSNPDEKAKLERLVQRVTDRTKQLREEGMCDADILDTVRKEVAGAVCTILDSGDVDLDPKKKAKIVDRILRKAFTTTSVYSIPSTEVQDFNSLSSLIMDEKKIDEDDGEQINEDDGEKEQYENTTKMFSLSSKFQIPTETEVTKKQKLADEINILKNNILEKLKSNPNLEIDSPAKTKDIEKFANKVATKLAKKANKMKGEGYSADEILQASHDELQQMLGKNAVAFKLNIADIMTQNSMYSKNDTMPENSINPKVGTLSGNPINGNNKKRKKEEDLDDTTQKLLTYVQTNFPQIRPKNSSEKLENIHLVKRMIQKMADLNNKTMSRKDKTKVIYDYIRAQVTEVLDQRPVKVNKDVMDTFVRKFLDKLVETVEMLAEDDKPSKAVVKKATDIIIQNIQKEYDKLKEESSDIKILKRKLFLEIQRQLDEILSLKDKSISSEVKQHLAEAIMIKFMKTVKKRDVPLGTASKLFGHLSKLSLSSGEQIRRKLLRTLVAKYRELKVQGMKQSELTDKLRKATRAELDLLLLNYSEHLRPAVKERIIDEVLNLVYKHYHEQNQSIADAELDQIFQHEPKPKQSPGSKRTSNAASNRLSGSSPRTSTATDRRRTSKQVAWFHTLMNDSSNSAQQKVVERLSNNIQRIEMRDLSPEEKRMQIEKELRYFTENVAEATQKIGLLQTKTLISDLLTGSRDSYQIPERITSTESNRHQRLRMNPDPEVTYNTNSQDGQLFKKLKLSKPAPFNTDKTGPTKLFHYDNNDVQSHHVRFSLRNPVEETASASKDNKPLTFEQFCDAKRKAEEILNGKRTTELSELDPNFSSNKAMAKLMFKYIEKELELKKQQDKAVIGGCVADKPILKATPTGEPSTSRILAISKQRPKSVVFKDLKNNERRIHFNDYDREIYFRNDKDSENLPAKTSHTCIYKVIGTENDDSRVAGRVSYFPPCIKSGRKELKKENTT